MRENERKRAHLTNIRNEERAVAADSWALKVWGDNINNSMPTNLIT